MNSQVHTTILGQQFYSYPGLSGVKASALSTFPCHHLGQLLKTGSWTSPMPSSPGPASWLSAGPCSLSEAKGSHSGTDTGQRDVLTCLQGPTGPHSCSARWKMRTVSHGPQGSVFMVHAFRRSLGQWAGFRGRGCLFSRAPPPAAELVRV